MQSDVPGKPRRSRGVPGSISGLKSQKTGPKIFSQTAFGYPADSLLNAAEWVRQPWRLRSLGAMLVRLHRGSARASDGAGVGSLGALQPSVLPGVLLKDPGEIGRAHV